MPKQRRLLLCARDRDPKPLFRIDAERRARQICEQTLNLLVADGDAPNRLKRLQCLAVRKELQGADTVASDLAQQAEGINAVRPSPFRHLTSYMGVVGQEIIKDGHYGLTSPGRFLERQGQ